MAMVPEPPVAVMPTEVCPDAQGWSRQVAPIAASDALPNVESWAKLPVTPPSVQAMAVGLVLVPDAATTTIRELLPPVGLSRVIVSEVRSEERRVGKECRSRWSPYH